MCITEMERVFINRFKCLPDTYYMKSRANGASREEASTSLQCILDEIWVDLKEEYAIKTELEVSLFELECPFLSELVALPT